MTGYTEEFTKIGGGGTRLRKGRKREAREKLQPKADYTAKGVEAAHSRKTMVLCFEPPLQLSLDTGCDAGSTAATTSGNRSPKGAVDTRKILHAMCFLLFLLHPTGRAKGQISIPCQRKGASRKEAKTRGILFSIIWRGWLQKMKSDAGNKKSIYA